ncbi:MAG: gluconate transporter [Planctomycetaceae bacterium]|nr:gluconate transporter [Planctomycetaceae bacterium]
MDNSVVTLLILLAGIVVVVGGVLALRLHAFLALVLGALLVGVLTPKDSLVQYSIEKAAVEIVELRSGSDGQELLLATSTSKGARVGTEYIVMRLGDAGLTGIGNVKITKFEDTIVKDTKRTLAFASSDDDLELKTTDVIVHPIDFEAAKSMAGKTVGERVATAFGTTCAKIGILIAMASIIGKCLLDSGSADRIVRWALGILGEKGAPFAFMMSGFLLGIPVFFDTVFYLMIPLGKAMTMRTGRNYLFYVLAIVAGGSMAHSLVPPTPGPLFVAEQLSVDMGTMILAGCVVGIFTAGTGYIYASFANRIWELPLRESADFSLEDLEQLSKRDINELPPVWLAMLPIVLPVILIAGYTVLKSTVGGSGGFMRVAATLGNKNIALTISAAIAMGTLVWQKRTSLKDLAASVQSSLASGGVIILITAGGGSFGGVLQQTGVSNLIRDLPEASPIAIVALAWGITAAIRTAQGSATVAMITAVGILAGIATPEQLGFHPVYLALAIGCGSKPVAWMNDSGFWVIGKMSGMTEGETLKYVTPMSTTMGIVGLVVVMIGVSVFPMV